jgi:hypothetical protein
LLEILERPDRYVGNPAEVAARFSSDAIAGQYESLYASLHGRIG